MRAARSLPVLATISMLALTSACGGGSETAATGAPASSAGGAGGTVVTSLKDFAITATPATIADGTVTFTVTNDGPATHALAIDGNGFAGAATGSLAAGATDTLTVKLPAGTYHLFCPIGGHRGLGMDATITVGSGGGATPAPAASTSSHAWS
jgi:uncharacterized cupredoxin-like copper-binding protein